MINFYPSSENPSREGCECAVAMSTAMIIAAAAGAATTTYEVHAQNAAADRSAELQTEAAKVQRAALANQSGLDQNNFNLTFGENKREWEATQRRNYEMWRTREQQLAPYREASLGAQNLINSWTGIQPVHIQAPPDYDTFSHNAGVDTGGGQIIRPANPPLDPNTPMPQGMDPRLAALYQRYGVAPGGRGSGVTDWQYWQNDALHNASGDWGYVLNRLESDLKGNGPDARGAGGPAGPAPTTLASMAPTSDGRVGPGNTSLAALMQPGTGTVAAPSRGAASWIVPAIQAAAFNPYSLAALMGQQPPTNRGDVPAAGGYAYA